MRILHDAHDNQFELQLFAFSALNFSAPPASCCEIYFSNRKQLNKSLRDLLPFFSALYLCVLCTQFPFTHSKALRSVSHTQCECIYYYYQSVCFCVYFDMYIYLVCVLHTLCTFCKLGFCCANQALVLALVSKSKQYENR